MPTVAGDIIRITCKYTYQLAGRPLSNVLHWVDNGAGGITDAALLLGMGVKIEGVFGSLAPEQSTRLYFTTYDVFNVTQGLIVGTAPWPTLNQGGRAGDLSASTAVGLLRMVTAKSRVQGRLNLVGLPEFNLTDSIQDAVWITAALLVGVDLLAAVAIGPSSLIYCVYNQEFGTYTLPVSVALGAASRSIGRRRLV